MARCPFARWQPISGPSGPNLGGPSKIVHHTTEGSTAAGALAAFARHRSDPHFTVDATTIWQHVDTDQAARALRNEPGGVQTNRDSAIQIELVGFAHLPKDPRALTNLARLCRWIEREHGVPPVWPSGPPKPAKNGRDPGDHRRDPATWESVGGHYGHSQVPENTHWDPGYTAAEAAFVLAATFDADGRLVAPPAPALPTPAAGTRRGGARGTPATAPVSTMPEHAHVGEPVDGYIRGLLLPPAPELAAPADAPVRRRPGAAAPVPAPRRRRGVAAGALGESPAGSGGDATINAGALVSFTDGVEPQQRQDVLYSMQLAQRGASGAFDRFTQTQAWYAKYTEILENLGWASEQFAFSRFDQTEGEFRMDRAALAIVAAIATQNQLAVLRESISALEGLADDDGALRLFDFHASMQGSGNFQIGAVQRSEGGALSMALGAFYFRSVDERRRFLFFRWGQREVNFWTAAQRMTLNVDFYARRRAEVAARLDADASSFIAGLRLGGR